MPSHPIFMSAEHITAMNVLLAESELVKTACAALDRDYCMLYTMLNGPGGKTIHWRADFKRDSGMRFLLEPAEGIVDAAVFNDYWDVIKDVEKQVAPLIKGDPSVIQKITAVLSAARSCGVAFSSTSSC